MASRILTQQVVGTTFAFYTDEEIKRLSIKRITNPVTFDSYGHPTADGLYDRSMGPTEYGEMCPTCGLTMQECPGHIGHIELAVPVYNPTLFPLLYRLLRLKCYACHSLRISAARSRVLKVKLMLLDCGRLQDAIELDARLASRPQGASESSGSGTGSRKREAADAEHDADIERQQQLLADLELDCLAAGGPDVGCSLATDGGSRYSQHVRQYRDAIVAEYLRSFPTKSCANCQAMSIAVRKDGYSKIFQKPLSRRNATAMAAMGVRYRSGTGLLLARAAKAQRKEAHKHKHHHEEHKHSKEAEDDGMDDPLGVELDEEEQEGVADLFGKVGEEEDMLGAEEAEDDEEEGGSGSGGDRQAKPRFMPASEVAAQLQLLWERESELLRRVFLPVRADSSLHRNKTTSRLARKTAAVASSSSGAAADGYAGRDGWRYFFLRMLPVPPARFRPPTRLGDQQFEHPQNVYLSKVLRLNDTLIDLGLGTRNSSSGSSALSVNFRGGVDLKTALSSWMELQNNVNGLIDSTKLQGANAQDAANGIRQLLEKKEGMFRKNMMGKRVNFAARTVISPDPFLRTDQVGVPLRFAKRLMYKQPVTAFNVEHMRKLVINGPDIWPGANAVEDANGVVTDLAHVSRDKREAIAKKLLTPTDAVFGLSMSVSQTLDTGVGHSGIPPVTQPSDLDGAAAGAAAAAAGLGGVGIKRVWRHLQDDDIVLMNRQPTLHKPSIMAHRARVMKNWASQQILRFHYANCKTYNADFDGDEMNMHLPQDDLSRSEAYNILATPYQYLAPTGGAPLRGLIQDHNAISAILTRRDCLLTKDQYCQLVFSGLQALPQFGVGTGISGGDGSHGVDSSGGGSSAPLDVPLLQPAILAPRRLWTGKQVVSTMLHALTAHLPPTARAMYIDGKAKIGDGIWGAGGGKKDIIPVGDSTITVRGNELLTGVLDKNALGNSSYGLIHCVYEVYGPNAAGALLSVFGRLLTVYLQHTAETCGMDDLVLNDKAETTRHELILMGREKGALASANFANVHAPAGAPLGVRDVPEVTALPAWMRHTRRRIRDSLRGGAAGADVTGAAAVAAATNLDNAVKSAMAGVHSAIMEACLPYGLAKTFPANQFSLMVTSGAKGSMVNHAMIAVGLGQQELEGRRVPTMSSGKALPCFPAFDPSPRAGGYVADRFLTGLRPQEYFFHSMSGREGLVDTAVKTSRSGYLQRCLIKHLEALRVHYDYSVRDSDGGVVQFMYGEDGFDVLNTPYLKGDDSQLTFLARNRLALAHAYGMASPPFQKALASMDRDAAPQHFKLVQELRGLLAGQKGAAALNSRALLSKGQTVRLRLPSELQDAVTAALPSADTNDAGVPEVSIDGRKMFAPGKLSSAHITAKVRHVREDGGAVSYDVRFMLTQSAPLQRTVTTASGSAKGKDAMEDAEDISSSSTSGAGYGVEYKQVSVALKKVPLLLVSAGTGAGGAEQVTVILQPDLPEPATALLRPATHLGSLSEKLLEKLSGYISRNPAGIIGAPTAAPVSVPPSAMMSDSAFQLLMHIKGMRSLVAPGEPVGVLAAQSIGEPSTQMTLNTFHLAGGGGVNVTLGIPRLREIVMTASANIKTPQMCLPLSPAFDKDVAAAHDIAGRIRRVLNPLPLSDLLDVHRPDGGIRVRESLRQLGGGAGSSGMLVREYFVRLFVTDLQAIGAAFGLSFLDISTAVGRVFTPKLLTIITNDLRKAARAAGGKGGPDMGVEKVKGGRKGKSGDGDGDDDGAMEDVDVTEAKTKARSKRAAKEADDEDDDEDDAADRDDDKGDEDGTLRVGTRKETSGYDDVDEEVVSSSDSDSDIPSKKSKKKAKAKGKKDKKSKKAADTGKAAKKGGAASKKVVIVESDDDGDSDDDAASMSSSASTSSSGSSSSSSSSGSSSSSSSSGSSSSASEEAPAAKKGKGAKAEASDKPKKGRLTAKRLAADAAGGDGFPGAVDAKILKPVTGTTMVEVPDSLLRNPRFGGVIACESGIAGEDVEGGPWVQVRLVFPASARKVLMLSSAERAVTMSMVRNMKGINRAVVARPRIGKVERTCVMTEGVNLEALWALSADITAGTLGLADSMGIAPSTPLVDINQLSTNDIAAVLRTYGVEAARANIMREMRNVFSAYGIGVDARHLSLIADYMTQGGGFRPMNRAGIEAHGSPYLKMSFETTAKFLTAALLNGEHERMVSPSARIVMGRVVDSGTGAFDVLQPLQ